MNVTRRTVFGGATAMAAVAAVPAQALALSGDRARLNAALSTGRLIQGEHFEFFDGKPVRIGGDAPFRLKDCRFTWHGKKPAGYLAFGARNNGEMRDCTFEHASGAIKPMRIAKI